MDPRIRIQTKMSWIRNTLPDCGENRTFFCSVLRAWQTLWCTACRSPAARAGSAWPPLPKISVSEFFSFLFLKIRWPYVTLFAFIFLLYNKYMHTIFIPKHSGLEKTRVFKKKKTQPSGFFLGFLGFLGFFFWFFGVFLPRREGF